MARACGCGHERGQLEVEDANLKAKIACELVLLALRNAVRNGLITAAEYEKVAKGMIDDLL